MTISEIEKIKMEAGFINTLGLYSFFIGGLILSYCLMVGALGVLKNSLLIIASFFMIGLFLHVWGKHLISRLDRQGR